MIKIDLPVSEKIIRSLKVGDLVSINGTIITARDAAHKFMIENKPEFVKPLLRDGAIYHCGPVMQKTGESWKAVAAGPTTSIREEPYEAFVISHYGVRMIIGKGGMAARTLEACKKNGTVYVHAVGGAAVLIADCIVKVGGVHMLSELGVPEAFWEFEVKDFRGVITMDSNGQSLHDNVFSATKQNHDRLIAC